MKIKGLKKAVGAFNRSVSGAICFDADKFECFYSAFPNNESGILTIVTADTCEKVTMDLVEQEIEEVYERYEHKRLMIELRGGIAL
jgi:hypothetical protein